MYLRTAIAVSLVIAAWHVPMRAQASCGDYVTMQSHRGGELAPGVSFLESIKPLFQTLVQTSADEHADRLQPVTRPRSVLCQRCPYSPVTPGNLPCRGPWCSDGRAPIAPAPTTVERPLDQWGLCHGEIALGNSEAIPHEFLRDCAERVHHVSPIYHPPRSVYLGRH
jgi:hypothetical protein